MLATIVLMVAGRSLSDSSAKQLRKNPVISRGRRLPVFALGIAVALVSLPAGAWAHAAGSRGTAQVDPSLPGEARAETTTAINATAARTTQANEYAAREASAKGLENFKGGDTVVIGGSVLVIVLVVILILILI
ncbi:MAG: hypothetical protein ABJA82_05610 [Myxococcales bacterium]